MYCIIGVVFVKETDIELLSSILRSIDRTNAEGFKAIEVYTANAYKMHLIRKWFKELGFRLNNIDKFTVELMW